MGSVIHDNALYYQGYVQTGHLCTMAQAGADPGIFVCRSKFPGLKVGRRS